MTGFLNFDGRFYRFVSKVVNLILLNILWILFSLPIITMGSATSALYSVTLNMVRNEEGYVIQSFWKGFKGNFKQSIILEVILLVYGAILIGDFKYFSYWGNLLGYVFSTIFSIGIIIFMFALIYTFPLVTKFRNSSFRTLKNAVLLSLTNLPTSIALTVLLIILLYGCYVSAPLMILISSIGVSFYAYIASVLLIKVFKL